MTKAIFIIVGILFIGTLPLLAIRGADLENAYDDCHEPDIGGHVMSAGGWNCDSFPMNMIKQEGK